MKREQVGAQLFTVREHCQTPQATAVTLRKLRGMGYLAVEVAGICDIPPADLRKMASDAGLTICAYHHPEILTQPDKTVEILNVLDCDYGVYSFPAGYDLSKEDEVCRLSVDLSGAGQKMSESQKTFCFHHHSAEFTPFRGSSVLEHLLRTIDEEVMKLELDTYWIQHGGGSPVEWIKALPNRVPLLHLKDYGNILGTPTFMEVGAGHLPWREIIAAGDASNTRWFVVEQDICPGDSLDSLEKSLEFIHQRLLDPTE